jgi:hypothetical protein
MKRISTFTISALPVFAFLLCILSACQREYSYEGGPLSPGSSGGTAIYTLQSTGVFCAGTVVQGNYYNGQALTANNKVVLKVNVTQAGTYNVKTNTSGGFVFSSSGTFTFTGLQTITLTGSGMPNSTGNFSFKPPVGAGCSFIISVTTAPPVIAGYKIASTPGLCAPATVNGTCIYGVALSAANTITITVDVISAGNYLITTDTLDGISFSKSGVFTAAGIQTILLNGMGTPVNPQNLYFKISGATSSCFINLTVQNPQPLATYVLESGTGIPPPCTGYTVLGNYLAGMPLNNSNTLTVKVTVTITGNFTIATNTVNGISFSYTGNFAATGTQYVVLKGSGTPVNTGIFSFVPQVIGPAPIGGEYCGASVTVN